MTGPTVQPRLHNGNPMTYIGRGYFVLLCGDTEVSERAWGGMWLGVEQPATRYTPGRMVHVLLPDSTNTAGQVVLRANSDADGWATCTADGVVMDRQWYSLRAHDEFHITWDTALEANGVKPSPRLVSGSSRPAQAPPRVVTPPWPCGALCAYPGAHRRNT